MDRFHGLHFVPQIMTCDASKCGEGLPQVRARLRPRRLSAMIPGDAHSPTATGEALPRRTSPGGDGHLMEARQISTRAAFHSSAWYPGPRPCPPRQRRRQAPRQPRHPRELRERGGTIVTSRRSVSAWHGSPPRRCLSRCRCAGCAERAPARGACALGAMAGWTVSALDGTNAMAKHDQIRVQSTDLSQRNDHESLGARSR
jgi:hypothetical protein